MFAMAGCLCFAQRQVKKTQVNESLWDKSRAHRRPKGSGAPRVERPSFCLWGTGDWGRGIDAGDWSSRYGSYSSWEWKAKNSRLKWQHMQMYPVRADSARRVEKWWETYHKWNSPHWVPLLFPSESDDILKGHPPRHKPCFTGRSSRVRKRGPGSSPLLQPHRAPFPPPGHCFTSRWLWSSSCIPVSDLGLTWHCSKVRFCQAPQISRQSPWCLIQLSSVLEPGEYFIWEEVLIFENVLQNWIGWRALSPSLMLMFHLKAITGSLCSKMFKGISRQPLKVHLSQNFL